VKNVWDLNLDIKFRYSGEIPLFRRKDSAVLNMYLYDAKVKKDISNFSKATLNMKFPSGDIKDATCKLMGTGIDTYVQYQFTEAYMLEEGVYDLLLTVEKDRGLVSTQKFKVAFFDAVGKPEYAFVEMIQDLQNQINYMYSIIDNLVLRDLIDQSNGLIPIGTDGKIDIKYMPEFLDEHIKTNIYLQMVHGFMVDKDLKLIYETKSGGTEYVGHKEGSGNAQKLNLTTTVTSGIVKLLYSGRGSAVEQRWLEGNKSIEEMKTSGTAFTGLEFKIKNTGVHTIYYKDNYGNEYLYKFSVAVSQLEPLEFNPIVKDGNLDLDSNTTVALIKLAKAVQTLEWMRRDGNGMIITMPYVFTEIGTYTIYIKDKYNRESIKVITITQDMLKPVVDSRPLEIRIYTNGLFDYPNDSPNKIPVGAVSATYVIYDADGKRAGDKVDYVIRPDSTAVHSDNDNGINLYQNRTYTWKCYNKAGIESTASITVANIGVEKNLKDMKIGDRFYLFQKECVLIKKDGLNSLISIPYSYSHPFYSQYATPISNSNLYPNSTIQNALFNTNFTDNEGQLPNAVKGKFNYQYGEIAQSYPYDVTLVGSPVYYEAERGIFDYATLKEFQSKGYRELGYDCMTSTPILNTQDFVATITGRSSSVEGDMRQVKEILPVDNIGMWFGERTKVWVKGW